MDAATDTAIGPEIAEYPEAGPFWVGLWAVARHWVGLLEQVFEPHIIETTGITRSFALRCSKWLWSIEGLVRRLIIAAAMKLDVSQLPRLIAGGTNLTKGKKPAAPTVAFKVLPRVPGRLTHTPLAAAHNAKTPEHRHLAFPGDTLLLLFPRHDKRNARPASVHRGNSLHRRGRRSRWDPDYQVDEATAQARHDRHFFGPFREYPDATHPRPEPRPRTRADRSSPYWKPRGGDLPEWKRVEQEWRRVIPSSRLARRIRALMRGSPARRAGSTPTLISARRSAPRRRRDSGNTSSTAAPRRRSKSNSRRRTPSTIQADRSRRRFHQPAGHTGGNANSCLIRSNR